MLESEKMLDKHPIIFAVDGVQAAHSKNSMGSDIGSHCPFTISETGYWSYFEPSSTVIEGVGLRGLPER